MAGQMQLIFLAIIALVHGKFVTEQNVSTNKETKIILDEKIDALLPSIHQYILENGLDPAQIPDYSEQFLPGIFIDLKKGWLQNLSLIRRTKHVIGIYKDKRITFDMDLGFNVLDCSYAYSLGMKFPFLKRRGDVFARFYQLNVNTVLTIDLSNYYIDLDSIKFSDVGKYDIKFEGHLLDRVLNVLTKVVTVFFEKFVLTSIEERSVKIFRAKIDEWNNSYPRPKCTLEEFINSLKAELEFL
ncbi:uncharacterized protein [Anoplolepis gracilipes]|uniref:uncharacterized protein n=1 Tax=Anoplolepis gracilipes TaxID=354296 RepID=UPI003BA075A8